jgi:hypothetical protein
MKSFHGLTSKLQTRSVLSVAIKESEKLQNWPLGKNRGNANVRVICCFLERRSPKHGFGDALGARSETARG